MNIRLLFLSTLAVIWMNESPVFAASNKASSKPKVWIYTDMSDKTLPGGNHRGTINDPDDISAMAGYLLMANQFETLGIVVSSTNRRDHATTPDQGEWARRFFGTAYARDLPNLNRSLGGYPEQLTFMESSIKRTAEKFDPTRTYQSLSAYKTIEALYDEASKTDDTINVLLWGSLTEPAILVSYLVSQRRTDILDRFRFIAHWTNSPLHQGTVEKPDNVANCREDADACFYLKASAKLGTIRYYECGAIGQHGIVSGAPRGKEYYDQFRSSHLGKVFVEGKYVREGVDHSDSATYWTLLCNWGVSLKDIADDGTNSVEVEQHNEIKFRENSAQIHEELLRRSRAAAASF
jgi:hypothetical protein